ncbi:MAG: hypothetical protein GY729_19485 [Desulfobacteraceae bacterium]|nr:hypothetical protein [Desulfobacteraceae bacterium]
MKHQHSMVELGFTKEKVPAGTHICQIFSDDDERNEALLQFILSGLKNDERAACFSEKTDLKSLKEFFLHHELFYDELEQSKTFSLAGTRDVYFQNNVFDPDRMLGTLQDYHVESVNMGFKNARVIGEMTPEIQEIEGGDRLLEYECRVSMLLEEHPVTAVCQYDAHGFDGATIMDILKVHPLMVVKGGVVRNPFFIPPDEFLAQ